MKQMKVLVQRITAAEYELQGYTSDDPREPVPAPPASPGDIGRLASHLARLGLPLPPTYHRFLLACDGIEGFMTHFSLLGVAGLIGGPKPRRMRDYPNYAEFVVGEGESLEFLAFDKRARKGDELEVVFVTDEGDESRYDNMERFLIEHLAALTEELEEERADRKNLKG